MKGRDLTDLVIVKLEEYSAFSAKTQDGAPLLSGGDNMDEIKPVYSYIDAHIAEAANEMLAIAPLNRLVPVNGKDMIKTIVGDDLVARTTLPVNYLRLHTIKMGSWYRQVHKAITMSDHLYTLQYNKFTKGTPQKPVAVYGGDSCFYDNKVSVWVYKGTSAGFDSAVSSYLSSHNLPAVYAEDLSSSTWYYCTPNSTSIDKTEIQTSSMELFSSTSKGDDISEFKYIPRFSDEQEYDREIAELVALNCAKKIMEIYGMVERANAMANEIQYVLNNMQF